MKKASQARFPGDVHIPLFSLSNLKRVDGLFLTAALALAAIGLVNMYSATYGGSAAGIAPVSAEAGGGIWGPAWSAVREDWFLSQCLYFVVGFGLAAFLVCVDFRALCSLGPFLYTITFTLLVAVLLVGVERKGATRWIEVGPVELQPSEFTKIALVLMLAWYLSYIRHRVRHFFFFGLALALMLAPFVLVFKQPSLSVALVLVPVALAMVIAAGCRWWHIGVLLLPAAIPACLVWAQIEGYQQLVRDHGPVEGRRLYEQIDYPFHIALKPHQLDRIMMFRQPERDRKNKGYQAIQARITVGSGEFLGKGFGQGTQTHLNFLPEFHTDFIVALLAEEWGFVGAATVVLLYALLTVRGLRVAELCPDYGGSLIALGCTAILAFHAFANLAITVGLLPVTGMPLPFLSYGGSFYITTAVCCGLILAVHVQRKPLAAMRRSRAIGLA